MVQLEQGGFSAVDEFFGVDNETSTKQSTHEEASSVLNNPAGRKRLGVGASGSKEANEKLSAGSKWEKQIFQVGKKRNRQDAEDDDEKIIDAEDDDEDDAGRTAISSQKKKIDHSIPIIADAPKKKKKKGKKERAKERGEEVPPNDATNQDDKTSQDEALDQYNGSDDAEGNNKKKRKRRKVRSRQKNIRKDNRQIKPEHLIVGSKDYKGRPLTSETRKRLNLPVSNAREKFQKMADKWSNAEEKAVEREPVHSAPKPMIETKTSESTSEIMSKTNASDPLKRDRNKKKSKYKNLR